MLLLGNDKSADREVHFVTIVEFLFRSTGFFVSEHKALGLNVGQFSTVRQGIAWYDPAFARH